MTVSEPAAARFDNTLDAWLLSRYADVAHALSEPRLTARGAGAAVTADNLVRESAGQLFASGRAAELQREMAAVAKRYTAQLQCGTEVDLVREFAEPWALEVALLITGARTADAAALSALARQIFVAAAHSSDGAVSADSQSAAQELTCALASAGATALIATQAFVALSQTLPCFLGNAWLALFEQPQAAAQLYGSPALLPQAIDELLRYAGPARAVFRQASTDLSIADVQIRSGQRVVLQLHAANHDPDQFDHPDQLDFTRTNSGLLSFGRGIHHCAGAQLVRSAAIAATGTLVQAAGRWATAGEVERLDGFAIGGVLSLPAVLHENEPVEVAAH